MFCLNVQHLWTFKLLHQENKQGLLHSTVAKHFFLQYSSFLKFVLLTITHIAHNSTLRINPQGCHWSTDVAWIFSLATDLTFECWSTVDWPVDKVEEDIWTRENHPWVFVNSVCVLDDIEATQALLLLGGGGLAAYWEVDHHVFRFLWNMVHLLFFGHYWLFSVASQTVGVSFTVGTIHHGHGSCLGDTAGAWQWLAEKKRTT